MRISLTIFLLLFYFITRAQLFTGTGGGIENLGQHTYFDIAVSGLNPTQLDVTFGIEQVGINITHAAVEQLFIYLRSPSGTVVELTQGTSCYGANYTNTYFNSNEITSVTLGTAPFTGNYKPTGFLGRFNTGQAGNGTWQLIVHDGLAFVDSGMVDSWSIQFGSAPSHPVVFTSSNLPIVVINTNSQSLSDTNILVSMGIIYNEAGGRNHLSDAANNYNGKVNISFRGSTSRNFEKKPCKFETCDDAGIELPVSLLGMPAESDWNLIANYQDKTLMRIPLTYDLSRGMGHYASRYKNVEVVINDEYRGVYALMEKPKRDSNRIDISKLTPDENSFPDITGGYIFKIDRPNEPGWSSLLPGDSPSNSHFFYQFVYPKAADITAPQQDYLKSFVDSFETVMNSPSFADPLTGYAKYIDVESFVDFFIINELSKNADAYRLSTYLYKDKITKGGKLHIGPVWDYDIAWHNCNYANSFDPNFWQYQTRDSVFPIPAWWTRFMQDTTFVNTLYCRWNNLRQTILSTEYLNNYIDSIATALNESQQRNFIQFPILGAYILPNPQNQLNADYGTEIADLKTWVTNRSGWMDWAIQAHCPIIGIEENSIASTIIAYPNPFQSSTTFKFNLSKDANVCLKIMDVMGREIAMVVNEHKPSGESKIIFDKGETPAGIYFYQLSINSEVKAGKIIIQ